MRFFIALEISEKNRHQLREVQVFLKELVPTIRLTENSKLHLTIAFIGEHPENLKFSLIEVMNKSAQEITPFEVTPAYIDAFPKLHEADTFWVGVKGDVDKLFLLQERIKDGLAALKLEVDNRRYLPHIAIGKVSDLKVDESLENSLEEFMIHHSFDPIRIDSIKLFESIPSQGFHQHNTLAEIKLD